MRFGGLLAGRRGRDARAGAYQLDRLHRFDHEIGNAHLQQATRDRFIERFRDHNNRRPGANARHQPAECLDLFLTTGIEVDDRNGDAVGIKGVGGTGERVRDYAQIDLGACAKGRARHLLDLGIPGQ